MSNRQHPNVPIIGGDRDRHPRQDEPNAPGLTINCEVYDSEVAQIQQILEVLNNQTHAPVSYDAFDRQIRERFQDIGFIVAVNWWETNIPEVRMPEVVIKDRIERKEFDYDKQVHEVTNDVLDLGDQGVIKSDDAMRRMSEEHGH